MRVRQDGDMKVHIPQCNKESEQVLDQGSLTMSQETKMKNIKPMKVVYTRKCTQCQRLRGGTNLMQYVVNVTMTSSQHMKAKTVTMHRKLMRHS